MSFKDRLERLHNSRRRQRERAEESEEGRKSGEGVYYAEETEDNKAEGGSSKSEPDRNDNVSRETPDRRVFKEDRPERPPENKGEVYDRLERSYQMKRQSRSGTPRDDASGSEFDPSNETRREGDLGEWVATLRHEAASALRKDNWEVAARHLFEIVALVPNHPYALDKLAEYHQRRGETAAAKRYRERLDRDSPFAD